MTIIYEQCLGHGNKIALKARWTDRWIVLKASKESTMAYYVPWNRNDHTIIMTTNEVARWVYDFVVSEVNPYPIDMAFLHDRLLSNLVTKGGNYSRAAVESLWSVLQQGEFLKLFLLAGNKHIPDVYGWCGHMYAMEYTPIGDAFRRLKLRHTMSWKSRVKIGLSFLEMVRSFKETQYGELSLCDVQETNFGLRTSDFTVQAIDIDLALLPQTRSNFVSQAEKCTKDSECDFFDCVAYCNYKTNNCTSQMKSSNFQNFCHDIFKTKYFVNQGLLEEAPHNVAHELGEILTKCASVPPNSTVKFPETYYSDLYNRLHSLLSKESQ